MEKPIILLILTTTFFMYNQPTIADVRYINVVDLGAKPDGITYSTQYFKNAWASACGNANPATIVVPQGRFLVSAVVFLGPCKNKDLTFQIDGTLVESSDYNAMGSYNVWIEFRLLDGLSVRGGVLDGQGFGLWDCKLSGNICPVGKTTLQFTNSNNIIVHGITSLNSQKFHIAFVSCKNVTAQTVKVSATENSPNTDGIHIQFSTGVTILNSTVSTGDDCISIGPRTTVVAIENVTCGPGHGISIGSLGETPNEGGVQNVTVKGVTLTNTQNGIRIKSWARPGNGWVKDIVFQQATMINVSNPIIIDQHYCPHTQCPEQDSGVNINGVTYQDIKGTSATEVAMKFDCSKTNPCSAIRVERVNLTYQDKQAKCFCANAFGTAIGLIEPPSCLTGSSQLMFENN